MITMLFLALAAQVQQPTAPAPSPAPRVLPSDGTPSNGATPAHDSFLQTTNRRLTPDARVAMHNYGRCVIGNSRELAAQTLREDFTSARYRSALRQLSRLNEGCFRQSGRMRASGLLFAGAVAEALLKEGADPLNARLARAALQPAAAAFSPTDRIAICVVRSLPDQIAQLFAAEPAGADEATAVRALQPGVEACSAGPRLEINDAGLRAMLATAAFRSINGTASPNLSQRD